MRLDELISLVSNRLSGGSPTDEERTSPYEIKVCIDICYAFLLRQQVDKDIATWGRQGAGIQLGYDPAIFTDKEYEIVKNKVTIDTQTFTIPNTLGVERIYFYDMTDCVKDIRILLPHQAQTACRMPWSDTLASVTGRVITFYNIGLLDKVNVVTAGVSLPDDADFSSEYPIKPELVFPTVDMAVKYLLGQLQMPQDVTNDNVDN
jgi:hypothetical protein